MRYDSKTMPDAVRRLLPPEEKKRLGVAGLCMTELIERQTINTEKAFQQQVADYLRLRGVPFYRSRMDKRTTNKKGQPDFLCCVSGRFMALECKMPGQLPTEEQQSELDAIRAAGGIALVVYDLAAVKLVLDGLQP